MNVSRGEIRHANLNPVRGSEQAGTRPVLIFQTDTINRFTTTVITIPFTTNLRRASLPSCIKISAGKGGLSNDSVALCHQLRVLDKTRLTKKLGLLDEEFLAKVDECVLFTLGIKI